MTKIFTYKAEDVFQDIKGDTENVLMNIPPEVAERMGWVPGDKLRIQVLEDGAVSMSKVDDGQE